MFINNPGVLLNRQTHRGNCEGISKNSVVTFKQGFICVGIINAGTYFAQTECNFNCAIPRGNKLPASDLKCLIAKTQVGVGVSNNVTNL